MASQVPIDEWVKKGIITKDQAQKLHAEVSESTKERSSVNIIVALSTIGAVALGVGVILFVASNWTYISAFGKVLFLTNGTVATAVLGYYLSYERKSYINVGRSLVFLGSILYCATIFLVAQIYHVNAHSHWLILMCLAGIAPLVYITRERVFSVLLSLGFYIWLGFIALRSVDFNSAQTVFLALPILTLTASLALFYIGGFHYKIPRMYPVARVYRLAAIAIGGLMLLLLTFEGVSGAVEHTIFSNNALIIYGQLTATTLIVSALTFILGVAYFLKNPTSARRNAWESGITLAILLAGSLYLVLPRTSDIFTGIFNILYIAMTLMVLITGYKREDMELVNRGIFFVSIYIIVRYFDLFWDLFDRSIFFIFGGVLLIGGGLILENQRRKLKAQFASHHD